MIAAKKLPMGRLMKRDKFLSVVALSEKRKNLLIYLLDGPKALDEIKGSLKVTATGVLPQIRILQQRNLVFQREDKKYALTRLGTVVATHLFPLVKTLEVIERHETFWEEHSTEAVPMPLLLRIGELGNCELIENPPEHAYEPHREFLENLKRSKRVMGISPVFHPIYPEFFLRLAQSGVEVSLILTRRVFERVKEEYAGTLNDFLNLKNAEMYLCEGDITLACVATDVFFSLSLFYKNGTFDPHRDLISYDKSALRWGKELFNYYRKRSIKIKAM